MEKKFDEWNKEKKLLNDGKPPRFYHEREIWWCSLGVNVGMEQDGTGKNFDRPIVIIRGFNERMLLCVALTGRKRVGKYYLYVGNVAGREATAILSQVRLIDTKRLVRKISTLNNSDFSELCLALQKILFP